MLQDRNFFHARVFARTLILCLIVLALLSPVMAQTGNGSIQGVIADVTGAVLPGAKVKITRVQTGDVRETTANERGLYVFPSLPIGNYKIVAEAPGMRAWEAQLTLQVGQTATIDAALSPASSTQEITVAGDVTQLVSLSNATLGGVLERSRIEQLPINGRFINTLVGVTVPGVEGTRVNGMRDAALEFVQDGAVLTNRDTGSLQGRPPGIDTVDEFKVETNNSSAKMNRPATAILTTKSGSNQLHGSLFETNRNSGYGVARARQDTYTKPPQLNRNEYGFSAGGPVYLPKLYNGKNQTFFFFAYEAYKQAQGVTTSVSMPTEAMRNGDFSKLIDSLGRPTTLYDPNSTGAAPTWSRTPFPNNQIPISRRSPLATHLYSITPLPTLPDVNPLVSSNYFGPVPTRRNDYTITLRADHRFSDRDLVFARYSKGNKFSQQRPNAVTSPMTLDGATNITNLPVWNHSGVVSWTHTISPTFFSETVASIAYENFLVSTGDYYKNYAGQLGLPNPFNEVGFPTVNGTGFGMTYTQGDTHRNNITRVINLDQNFTKVKGNHEMLFGGRYRHERNHVLPDQQYVSGNMSFSSLATSLYDPGSGSTYGAVPRTGHDSANLFLGIANTYNAVFTQKWYRFRDQEFAGYFQDNFKVSQRLSINFGVRWEFHPALHEHYNLFLGFDPASKRIVTGQPLDTLYQLGVTTPAIVRNFTNIGAQFTTPDEVGLPSSMVNANKKDFGPRLGFAYRLGGSRRPTSLRGGYALFAYPPPLRNFDAVTRSNPPFNASFTNSLNSAAQSPDGLPNYGLRSTPAIIAGVNSANVINVNQTGLINRGGFTTVYFDPNQPTTRAHEWNLTLEREVITDTVLRVAYVGTRGSRLEQFQSYNNSPNDYIWFTTTGQPAPTGTYSGVARRTFDQQTYGEIRRFGKTGYSNMNGFTAEVQRRYKKGVAFQMFYVLNNAFRIAGDGWRDDLVYEPGVYMPGAVPTNFRDRNRFLNYRRDTSVPQHRIRWNWLVDIPVGKGKRFLGNSGRALDALVGGWQLAGFGTGRSNFWALPTGNWGTLGDVEIYGAKYPIEDCRSGRCSPGYLYYNGYIPANRINSYDAQGRPNGVMGVPSSYKPASTPIITTPANGGSSSDPNFAFYESNTVWIPLKNGTLQRTSMNTNLHPWRNQYIPGPWNWGLDASLFKSFRLREGAFLRFNADFFQVMNNPGMGQPDSTSGILSLQNSSNGARQLQLTLRLTW
jgi:hypothetical protein